jgi:siroheme synthase
VRALVVLALALLVAGCGQERIDVDALNRRFPTIHDQAQELAQTVAVLAAGDRGVFATRAERMFEERTNCRASLYPAYVVSEASTAEAVATRQAIRLLERDPIYDFIVTAEADRGSQHVGLIVGVSCG